MRQPARHPVRLLSVLAAAGLCVLAAPAAMAQYKVIGPDGRVTYTDREPSGSDGRVVPIGARATATIAAESELPFELRQVATKYPVTLYVITTACEPCSAARNLLKQRGIPFSERMVVSNEDADALEKLTGARDAPTLTIGSQTLRGLSSDTWNSYLDAAGYPRNSLLPASYQYRPATPVVARASAAAPDTRAAAAAPPTTPTPLPAGPGGIRF